MAIIRVEMTFPPSLKDEPMIYKMGHDFKVVPKIIEASFSASHGWAVLNLEGSEDELELLLSCLKDLGVIVDKRQ